MTRQRALIYRTLCSGQGHMTAEEIYLRAKEKMPGLAMGTVYRNLNLMAAEGEIRRVEMPGAPDRFDANMRAHDHLICQNCGALSDIHLGDFKSMLETATGVKVLGYDLNVRYLCPACQRQQDERSGPEDIKSIN